MTQKLKGICEPILHEELYAISLPDYSLPGFVSGEKLYFGTLADLEELKKSAPEGDQHRFALEKLKKGKVIRWEPVEADADARLDVLEYVMMLREFLRRVLEYKETVWWLNCIPNFLYTPYLTFDRARNQQGLFVYQAYLSFTEEVYGAHILSRQRVWPDQVIVVENKQRILQELDLIGINDRFIYDDFDTIAKYVVKRHKKQS